MPMVLKIIGVAGPVMPEWCAQFIDTYVETYNPDGHDGNGSLTVTVDPKQALQFPNTYEALECWRQVSKTHPTRDHDGRPNRPLTMFTVITEPLE